MAGVDHSIYFQQQPLDILGNVTKGMQLGNQFKQAKFEEAERLRAQQEREQKAQIGEAYRSGLVQNPDGTVSYDNNRVNSALAQLAGNQFAGQTAYDFNQNLRNQKATDEDRTRAAEKFLGDQNLQAAQIRKMNAETNELLGRPSDPSRIKLPIDQQKVVETLATKNANKIAIKNQIDAVMSNWDNLSDDQKVATGRSLLKTLNSTEGADAIGAEEAKRLGSKLEFATGNIFNSNPIQFGRDLSGFAEQARNTSKGISDAVGMNQKEIDRTMGRTTSNQLSAKPTDLIPPKAGKVIEGYRFKGGDPSKQSNWEKI